MRGEAGCSGWVGVWCSSREWNVASLAGSVSATIRLSSTSTVVSRPHRGIVVDVSVEQDILAM
jgi:hypothetical protein